jgi:voltage-gated potassium channel
MACAPYYTVAARVESARAVGTDILRNRLLGGCIAMAVVIAGGTLGYYTLGDGRWALFDCLYMTMVTVTTVGYAETLPGMETVEGARAFTLVLVVFGTGVLVFFVSTITAFIVEGELKRMLAASRRKKRIKRMHDHVIVCGAGTTGRHIINELFAARVPCVAIDTDEEALRAIAGAHPKAEFSYIVGDATDDDVLAQSNLAAARGLVVALSSDKDNLYVTVAARFITTSARIVARAQELQHVDKLRRAGADAVVSPNHIGGMRMVSEMLRPSVVKFLDEMLRDKRAPYRIDEVAISAGTMLDGVTLRDAAIREKHGMSVLAVRPSRDAPWVYNPEASMRLEAGMTLVVLGSVEQVAGLRASVTAA